MGLDLGTITDISWTPTLIRFCAEPCTLFHNTSLLGWYFLLFTIILILQRPTKASGGWGIWPQSTHMLSDGTGLEAGQTDRKAHLHARMPRLFPQWDDAQLLPGLAFFRITRLCLQLSGKHLQKRSTEFYQPFGTVVKSQRQSRQKLLTTNRMSQKRLLVWPLLSPYTQWQLCCCQWAPGWCSWAGQTFTRHPSQPCLTPSQLQPHPQPRSAGSNLWSQSRAGAFF